MARSAVCAASMHLNMYFVSLSLHNLCKIVCATRRRKELYTPRAFIFPKKEREEIINMPCVHSAMVFGIWPNVRGEGERERVRERLILPHRFAVA